MEGCMLSLFETKVVSIISSLAFLLRLIAVTKGALALQLTDRVGLVLTTAALYSEVILMPYFFSKSLVPLNSLHQRSRHLASRSITL